MSFSFRKIFNKNETGIGGALGPGAGESGGLTPAPYSPFSSEQADPSQMPMTAEAGGLQPASATPSGGVAPAQAKFTVGELVHLLPPSLVRPGGVPLSHEVFLDQADLATIRNSGAPTLKASMIFRVCPNLFTQEITEANDMDVYLPPSKLAAMAAMAGKAAEGVAPVAPPAADSSVAAPMMTNPEVAPSHPETGNSPFGAPAVQPTPGAGEALGSSPFENIPPAGISPDSHDSAISSSTTQAGGGEVVDGGLSGPFSPFGMEEGGAAADALSGPWGNPDGPHSPPGQLADLPPMAEGAPSPFESGPEQGHAPTPAGPEGLSPFRPLPSDLSAPGDPFAPLPQQPEQPGLHVDPLRDQHMANPFGMPPAEEPPLVEMTKNSSGGSAPEADPRMHIPDSSHSDPQADIPDAPVGGSSPFGAPGTQPAGRREMVNLPPNRPAAGKPIGSLLPPPRPNGAEADETVVPSFDPADPPSPFQPPAEQSSLPSFPAAPPENSAHSAQGISHTPIDRGIPGFTPAGNSQAENGGFGAPAGPSTEGLAPLEGSESSEAPAVPSFGDAPDAEPQSEFSPFEPVGKSNPFEPGPPAAEPLSFPMIPDPPCPPAQQHPSPEISDAESPFAPIASASPAPSAEPPQQLAPKGVEPPSGEIEKAKTQAGQMDHASHVKAPPSPFAPTPSDPATSAPDAQGAGSAPEQVQAGQTPDLTAEPIEQQPAADAKSDAQEDDQTIVVSMFRALAQVPEGILGFPSSKVPNDLDTTLPFRLIRSQLSTGQILVRLKDLIQGCDTGGKAIFAHCPNPEHQVQLPLQDVFHSLPGDFLRPRTRENETLVSAPVARGEELETPFSKQASIEHEVQEQSPAPEPIRTAETEPTAFTPMQAAPEVVETMVAPPAKEEAPEASETKVAEPAKEEAPEAFEAKDAEPAKEEVPETVEAKVAEPVKEEVPETVEAKVAEPAREESSERATEESASEESIFAAFVQQSENDSQDEADLPVKAISSLGEKDSSAWAETAPAASAMTAVDEVPAELQDSMAGTGKAEPSAVPDDLIDEPEIRMPRHDDSPYSSILGEDHQLEMEDEFAAMNNSPVPFDSLEPLASHFSSGDGSQSRERKLAVPDISFANSTQEEATQQGMSSAELLASEAFTKYINEKPEGPTTELQLSGPEDMTQLVLRAVFMTEKKLKREDVLKGVSDFDEIKACATVSSKGGGQSSGFSRASDEEFAGHAPSLYEKVTALTNELGIPDAETFTIRTGDDLVSFFTPEGGECLAVRHDDQFQPGTRQKLLLIAREMGGLPD